MLSICACFTIIILIAAALAAAERVRIAHMFLPAVCYTGLTASALLVLGLAGMVPYVFAASGVAAAVVLAVVLVRDRKAAVYVLTTELAVFAAIAFACVLLNYGRVYVLNDEFSHWGLAVKNIFTVGQLPFGSETNALYRDYPPFATAICYLGTCFEKNLNEGATYVPMNLAMCAAVMPVLSAYMRGCARKGCARLGRVFVGVPVLALLCGILCFKLSAFTVISVDTLMGLLAFYVVAEVLAGKGFGRIVHSAVAASCLVLTKNTGIAFACFAAAVLLAVVIANGIKKKDANGILKRLCAVVIPVVAGSAAAKALWSLVLTVSGAYDPSGNPVKVLGEVIVGGLSDVRKETARAFFRAWVEPRFSVGLPLVAVVAVLIIVEVLTVLLLVKLRSRNTAVTVASYIAVTVCFFLYMFGVLVGYWAKFSDYEATTVASFERYVGTYLTFWLCLILMTLISVVLPLLIRKISLARGSQRTKVMIATAATCLAVTASAIFFGAFYPYRARASVIERKQFSAGEGLAEKCEAMNIGRGEKILLFSSSYTNKLRLAANYNAAPYTVTGGENWLEIIENGECDFVYFSDVSDAEQVALATEYLDLGGQPDSAIEAGNIYRIKSGSKTD